MIALAASKGPVPVCPGDMNKPLDLTRMFETCNVSNLEPSTVLISAN